MAWGRATSPDANATPLQNIATGIAIDLFLRGKWVAFAIFVPVNIIIHNSNIQYSSFKDVNVN